MVKLQFLALLLVVQLAAYGQTNPTVLKSASKTPAPAEKITNTARQSAPLSKANAESNVHPKVQKVEDMMDSFQIMEKSFWDGWKRKDIKPFEQHMPPNALMIDNTGLADRAAALKGLASCEVKGYSLSDFKLTKVDNESALLTYKADNVEAVCDGQKAPASIYASTLFTKSGGKWWMLFHQESAVMPNARAQ